MKTTSVNVMNLCVPCENRCRYCLLSYDGKIGGIDFARGEAYAGRFYEWIQKNRPDLNFNFGFGYSMEHQNLMHAIDFCRSIGSATGEFLQFDGMRIRNKAELKTLLQDVKKHGVKLIDLTFYGLEHYHDCFAARRGDYQLMMDTLEQANLVGLDVVISIPLNQENISQIGPLIMELERFLIRRIVCFVPHSEGRGRMMEPVRLKAADLAFLSDQAKSYINLNRFRTEADWLSSPIQPDTQRALTITLTPQNIDRLEQQDFAETIRWLEELDDAYFREIPSFESLAQLYGDPNGQKLYSQRDLYMTYQYRYIQENGLDVYNIHDERQCFVRRF